MRTGTLITILFLQTILTLGAVAGMLAYFGNQLDSTLDDQVTSVENKFDRDLDTFDRNVRREVRRELDARLGPARSSTP